MSKHATIEIKTTTGPMNHAVEIFSCGLAIHRAFGFSRNEPETEKWWRVTHSQSGYRLASFPTKYSAVKFVRTVAKMYDWHSDADTLRKLPVEERRKILPFIVDCGGIA